MDPIAVYNLDEFGVVVDSNPLGGTPGELTKAQNATADPLGEKGSIRKRPGLKKFNATAGNGVIRGGVSVPITLGSAGQDFQNPFPDLPISAANFTRPVFTTVGLITPRFDENSDAFTVDEFDDSEWETQLLKLLEEIYRLIELLTLEEQDEIADLSPREQVEFLTERFGEDIPSTFSDAARIFSDTGDVADFNDNFDSPEAPQGNPAGENAGNGPGGLAGTPNPLTTNVPSALYTLTVVGSGTEWYVGLNETLTEHYDDSTTYPNPATLLFPEADVRSASPLSDWTTGGSTSALRGRSMTTLNGAIIYVQS